ncbi:hypothetical protein AL01_03120 [Bombella intestini]|uniref:Integrase n=1 Tax=Bombella intestini TaxID=1539051 RepID=A0A1S8GSB0_9PROT|nr:site-specific integrase [Bombella intestini]OOL19942.1 hypothetical protein AL01_03120 [Bombella intestini]
MARRLYKLTDKTIQSLPEGNHSDGGNLYIRIRVKGDLVHRFWNIRYKSPVTGRIREMGIGSLEICSLREARQKAFHARKLIADGMDPLEERQCEQAEHLRRVGKTFAYAVQAYLQRQKVKWRDPKAPSAFLNTLEQYAFPIIGQKPVAAISQNDVLAVLLPIWESKTETARRIRNRIEQVLDYATALHWREGDNPARWNGPLAHILPEPAKLIRDRKQPHYALTVELLGQAIKHLEHVGSVGALAVRFCAFTVCRSGEVRGARWQEINLTDAVWTIPAHRMKAGKEHRVPLSRAAMSVLELAKPLYDGRMDALVFPNNKGAALSDVALSKALKNAAYPLTGDRKATVHGMRSTFRDWVAEETEYDATAAELALAHTVGSTVERAYRRGDMFAKRRALMEAWAERLSFKVNV